jgi:gliding motility-associated-like protein
MLSPGDFNILHRFENETEKDTIFNVELIATTYFGCSDTGQTSITVHPSPKASFTADPLTQMIPDRTVTFSNTTENGNWTYLWRFGDDGTSVERQPASHVYSGPGRYLVYLVVRSEHCADSSWVNAEIVPHPPIAAFKPLEPGCMPLTVQFENMSAYSTSFLWEFGDGAVSNKPNPEYTYYEPGTYTIKLTAWGDNGSVDSYSTDNDVYVLPNAFFDIKPRRVYANDQNVLFENQSDNGSWPVDGNSYLWDFGDGVGSEEESPTHMYKEAGNYNVTLNVWTNKGCYDVYEYTAAVLVEPIGKVVFPDVFSPEAVLEENKIFKPALIDYVDDYHLMIFNRWGELIFESFSQDLGWNGIINGKPAKEDVYVWKVEGKYTNGQTFILAGDVTLLH